MTTYQVQLQVLTPVHIGTGNELRHRFEYVVHEHRTWRLHVDRILEERYQDWEAQARQGRQVPPAALLTEADFGREEFFRYVIPGVPRSQQTFAELRECIKDPWDRPYIPGSSLKGAIRTALAWAGWEEAGLRLERRAIGRRAKFAGQPLEKRLFGPDPNHDLLRALQVSDLFGPQQPGEKVAVLNAQVVTRDGLQAPIPVEAVVNATFEGTLKVDDYLFSGQAKRLGFRNRRHWLTTELLPRLRTYSRARLEALADRFAFFARHQVPGADKMQRYFGETLLGLNLSDNATLLALGWGTGWDGKTFWTHLQQDPTLFEALVRDFRLQRRPPGAPPRRPGDPFPASRRAVVRQGKVVAPFGWVVLSLKETRP